ncbi:iron complex transport system substrate-binding protein [Desulfocicer vacuolatum DSM 3385]|uniref:Iron complex transport system substrate-binding protein n=1 Tax=Desulfocicer vacuolatum DSM 3385 TaxID=1121400 RepID=A0A1W2EVG0_9BACT|nr:ABC transporter substrate-binding protein [Desulfocicer vacuolatum]SMD13196.1 iron complex transport system substrate-binding protein [Desulfocicer vacuolatum DSM 3385]
MVMVILFFIIFNSAMARARESRIITDMAGRKVILRNNEARRIIPTFKPVTLCILALGLQERLVGIDTHSKKDKLTRAVFPGVTQLTGVGTKSTGINLETMLSLKPDLVILYAQKDGMSLATRLETMGIPAVIILPESMNNIKRSLDIISRAAGTPQNASSVINAMDKTLNLVHSRVATIPKQNKKRAYFASSRSFFNTAAGNMLQDNMLSRAGMINVSHALKGYFQDISPEQFLAWNPDIIFMSRNLNTQGFKPIKNPALKKVTALAHQAIHRFPSNLAPWDFPSPLSVLGTLWAACRAYPEYFQDIDFTAYANDFHRVLFQKDLVEMGGRLDDQLPKEIQH